MCTLQAGSALAELPHTSVSGGTVACGSLGSGKLGHAQEAGAHGTGNLITISLQPATHRVRVSPGRQSA